MKPLGVVRRIDDLGRVVAPKEVRKALNWNPGTAIEMFAVEDGLFLKAYGTRCPITGESDPDNLIKVDGVPLSKDLVDKIKRLDTETTPS